MNTNLFQLAGWSALISTLITLFATVTFAIGLKVGWKKVGLPNDIAGATMFVLYIPIFLGLDRVTHASFPTLSWILLVAGLLAAAVAAFVQIIFILRFVDFNFTVFPVSSSSIVIGLVLIVFNWLAFRNGAFPSALTIIGIIAYMGMIVASIGMLIRQGHPLTWIGGSISVLGIVWLAWVGWLWLEMK